VLRRNSPASSPRLPIRGPLKRQESLFGRAAYERLNGADEVEPNKSKGKNAKRTLLRALARTNDVVEAITPDIYRAMLEAGECTMTDVVYSEWGLELHTDELLHEELTKAETLLKVKARWKR